jgi:hypothetical protein
MEPTPTRERAAFMNPIRPAAGEPWPPSAERFGQLIDAGVRDALARREPERSSWSRHDKLLLLAVIVIAIADVIGATGAYILGQVLAAMNGSG